MSDNKLDEATELNNITKLYEATELDNKLKKATELVNRLNNLLSAIDMMSAISMPQTKHNSECLTDLHKNKNLIDKQLETILFDEEKKNRLIDVPKDNLELTKYVEDTIKYYNDSKKKHYYQY
jgi:hypothetical protein